jgi:hypothetical protein
MVVSLLLLLGFAASALLQVWIAQHYKFTLAAEKPVFIPALGTALCNRYT